jgi:hypothetical protein
MVTAVRVNQAVAGALEMTHLHVPFRFAPRRCRQEAQVPLSPWRTGPMTIRLCVAAGVAAISVAAASPAMAADLYGPAAPYDEQRYGEAYRYSAPPPRYAEPYPNAYRPPYRGERESGDYLAPMQPPGFGGAHPSRTDPRYADRCAPRALIREQLHRQGWRTIEDVEIADGFVFLRAQDWRGNVFDVRLDRCSGRVLQTRLIERQPPPPAYAWRYRNGYRPY